MGSSVLIPAESAEMLEKVLLHGDLERLTPGERLHYYSAVCRSVGLNPLTRPFEYIKLNGKLTLYAKRECTEQLRTINKVSVTIKSREVTEGCYVVTACAMLPNGRTDESIGAVPIEALKGEARANAMMKAETKAKRRVTMAICGLSFLDETEVDSVASAARVPVDPISGEIIPGTKEAAQAVAQEKIAQIDKDRIAREAAAQPAVEHVSIVQQLRAQAVPIPEETPIPEPHFIDPYEPRPVFNDEPGLQPPHDAELEASLKAFPPKVPAKRIRKITATEIEVRQWFAPLHKGYEALDMESRYRDILWRWNCRKCTDFKVSDGEPDDMARAYTQALECRNYMQIDLQTLQAQQQDSR